MTEQAQYRNVGLNPHENLREIPDDFFYLNPDGTISKEIVPYKKMENSHYWLSKSRIIGAVMLLSSFTFVMILLNETKVLEMVWQFSLEVISSILVM